MLLSARFVYLLIILMLASYLRKVFVQFHDLIVQVIVGRPVFFNIITGPGIEPGSKAFHGERNQSEDIMDIIDPAATVISIQTSFLFSFLRYFS